MAAQAFGGFAQVMGNGDYHYCQGCGCRMLAWQKDCDACKILARQIIYSSALIDIASKGCEFSFDDDKDVCSTAPGYHHNYWCSPCLANEALEKA